METMRPALDREERADSKGRSVGRRGFGVGVLIGSWGIGGASWSSVFVRNMREPGSSVNAICEELITTYWCFARRLSWGAS